jgi:molybdate transport system substrate-binding protein
MHFIQSGNAELDFVARSQVFGPGGEIDGSDWEIPQSLYEPIEQQAVLLSDSQAASDFLAFVRSREAREIIRAHGYESP